EKNLNNKVNELDKEKVTEKVNQGVATENYWFYRLDYKLWKAFEHRNEEGNPWKNAELEKVSAKKEMIETFYLKNLNSVEHIYPQTPTDECEENWQKDKKCLDSFGNLALISKHMNSKLSNQCFEKKSVDVKNQIEKSTVESLKLLLVFAKYDKWTAENCEKHQNEMVGLLQKPHHAAGS
ncbi:HNH endonuclease family protein, partial [Hydrogenimonas sp.]